MMKNIKMCVLIFGMLVVCFGMIGCDDDDDNDASPTTAAAAVDVSGTYSVAGTLTPVSGDCHGVIPENTGTATLSQSSDGKVTVESCDMTRGPSTCEPSIHSGMVQGDQVTMQVDVELSELEIRLVLSGEEIDWLFPDDEISPLNIHVSVSGTVADTSQFTLTGQGTKEPGTCVVDASVTLTKM
jgi:hypothetical protein